LHLSAKRNYNLLSKVWNRFDSIASWHQVTSFDQLMSMTLQIV